MPGNFSPRLSFAEGLPLLAIVAVAVALATFVYKTTTQVRQALAKEVLQQQNDIHMLVLDHDRLLSRLRLALNDDGPEPRHHPAIHKALEAAQKRLDGMRRDYSFASLDGAAAAHALIKPVLADVARWLRYGLPGYPPLHPLTAHVAHRRVADSQPRLLALTAATDELASALIQRQSQRLDWFNRATLGMLTGFLLAVLATLLLLLRRRGDKARLNATRQRAEVTLRSIGDAVITTDKSGRIDYLNPVAEAMTGWSLDEARGRPLRHVLHGADAETRRPLPDPIRSCLEPAGDDRPEKVAAGAVDDHDRRGDDQTVLLMNRRGEEFIIRITASPIRDHGGVTQGAVLVLNDLSEAHRLESEIRRQASHDALTGLLNRHAFERQLHRLIEQTHRDDSVHALCYMDLDQFKIVNDSCGHGAGDELLRQIAEVFARHTRRQDAIGRLGGDEFAVLLQYCNPEQAWRIANTLRQAVEEFRFGWRGTYFGVGVSIGLVPIDTDSESASTVLRTADNACYLAKDAGRNRVHLYRPDDAELARRRGEMRWVRQIDEALTENRFRLYAQPIVPVDRAAPPAAGAAATGPAAATSAATSATKTALAAGNTAAPSTLPGYRHYELLLRMVDENGEEILPGAFLPAAERYNMSGRIDRWVVDTAFAALADNAAWLATLRLCTINLSALSLGDDDFLCFILQRLDQQAVGFADKLCFEITETAAIANLTDANRFIKTLRQRGCRFALDDFGSGLSSFAYLKNLPVDYVKIDGLFVRDIVDDPIDLALVRSINEIGQLMGKQTIAEFAESDAVLDELARLGVDYAQGYGVGRPQALRTLLNTHAGERPRAEDAEDRDTSTPA